ncbi:MAG: chemotaxis protein CheX [Myxococcales bacterium]|nr:chemotaxis protein CheX [Myxococcales bacterium]
MDVEQRVRELMSSLTTDACVKLFQDYHVTVSPDGLGGSQADGMLYCGIVGFTGNGIRGSLVLSASQGPLEGSNPVRAASQRDWTAELSNQLAGRVKNQLLPYQVDIAISTPVVLRGEHIFLEARSGLQPLVFDAPGGSITVWIDVELIEGFEICFERDESQAAVSEGEALLF